MWLNIFRFAWRNIFRNKRRTLFTIVAITFGIIMVIFARSFINGIVVSSSEAMINTRIGHIQIADKEFLRLERIIPKESLVNNSDKIRERLSAIDDVDSIEQRIKFRVLLNHGDTNEPAVAEGIEPANTDKNLKLSKAMVKGTLFKGNGLNLVLGKKLAQKLKVDLKDELLLVTTDINYSTYALPFKVVGIFETGYPAMDKHTLYIPLEKARTMLDCGNAAHQLLVFLKTPDRAPEVAAEIEKIIMEQNPEHSLAIIPWQKNNIIVEFIPMIEMVWGKILLLIMFIVALVILNTMLMTVMERYHEIGVIKAMGLKNSEIFFMVMVEALYIGTIGSVLGGIFGGTLAAVLEKTGIDLAKMVGETWDKIEMPIPMFGSSVYPDLTVEILVGGMVFGLVMSLLAVLYPAIKSSRMRPVDAFHSKLNI